MPDGPYKPEQEQKDISEADLGQRVLEREVGHRLAVGPQEHPESDEQERPPGGVEHHPGEHVPLGSAAGDGERQGHPDQEGEPWLDHVVERRPGPRHVVSVELDDLPDGPHPLGLAGDALLELFVVGDSVQGHPGGDHEEHDQPAVGVDGGDAGGFGGGAVRVHVSSRRPTNPTRTMRIRMRSRSRKRSTRTSRSTIRTDPSRGRSYSYSDSCSYSWSYS